MDKLNIYLLCTLVSALAAGLYCEEWWRNRRKYKEDKMTPAQKRQAKVIGRWERIKKVIIPIIIVCWIFSAIIGFFSVLESDQQTKNLQIQVSNLESEIRSGVDTNRLSLPIATRDDLEKDEIVGKTVFISEIPYSRVAASGVMGPLFQTVGKTFIKCDIYGPAVIHIGGKGAFDHNILEGKTGLSFDSFLLQTVGPFTMGVIAFTDCSFGECKFFDVGIVGNADELRFMKQNTGELH